MTFSANPSKGEKMTGSSSVKNDAGSTGAGGEAVPPRRRTSPFPRKGDRMRFMNRNGYDGEREAAAKVFYADEILTVERCDVGSWSHSLWFSEHPTGRGWNGVMFEFVGEPERYPLPAADAAPLSGSAEGVAVTLPGTTYEDLVAQNRALEERLRVVEGERDEAIRKRDVANNLRGAEITIADKATARAQVAEAALTALRGEVVKRAEEWSRFDLGMYSTNYDQGREAGIRECGDEFAQLASTLTVGDQGLSSSGNHIEASRAGADAPNETPKGGA